MAWNERTLMDHQYRRRGQVQAMSLMLQVLKLHTLKARIELLRKRARASLIRRYCIFYRSLANLLTYIFTDILTNFRFWEHQK